MRWPVTMHGGTWCDNRLGPGGSPGAIEQLAVVADGPRHDAWSRLLRAMRIARLWSPVRRP